MKKIIRLTESDLHSIIKESVNRILKEGFDQYSDEDFASIGNPYEIDNDDDMAISNVINERIKGEKGMNDDEVMRRRNDNFRKDADYVPNKLCQDPYTPNYTDKEEMEAMYHTPEEMELRAANDRLKVHKATQKVHRKPYLRTLLKKKIN